MALDQTSNQGIIVVSHPRSGSTEFIRILAHFVAKQLIQDKPVGLLAEFFHWGDPSTFGSLSHARFFQELDPDATFPYQTTVLEPNSDLLSTNDSGNIISSPGSFHKPVTKLFTSCDDVRNYYVDQFRQRITFVNETLVDKYFPIIKSFPGFVDFYDEDKEILKLQQTLVSKLNKIEPVFFYRKNLIDSVYSDLIKWHYVDAHLIKDNANRTGEDGHNVGNTMPLLIPKPGVVITESEIDYTKKMICETLKNYQINRRYFKNVIDYDQVFVDKKFNLIWNGITYQIPDDIINGFREYPMNYQAAKKDYFENSEVVIGSVTDSIKKYGLGHIVDELGIVLP